MKPNSASPHTLVLTRFVSVCFCRGGSMTVPETGSTQTRWPLDSGSRTTQSASFDHAARIEDMSRVERVLDPARQRGERRRLRLEHRDRAAQGRCALDERGM